MNIIISLANEVIPQRFIASIVNKWRAVRNAPKQSPAKKNDIDLEK